MKLILVRHGETFENLKGITQGHFNSQLSPEGIEQAKKVAERLKDMKIGVIFSSDLDRAMNTSKEILKHHPNTKFVPEKILREQSKGIFEGKKKEGRNKMLNVGNVPFHEWHPEGGERLIDVWEKVIPFLEKIKKEYADKTVLFVSHGGPISCILSYLHGKPVADFGIFLPKMANTSISIADIDSNGIKFETLNCSKHLWI